MKGGKPLFEEDGVTRGLLEKYDEEAPDDGMQIDESGVVADDRTRRQEEIRRKLAAGACPALGRGATRPHPDSCLWSLDVVLGNCGVLCPIVIEPCA